jgi:hypothetical protein
MRASGWDEKSEALTMRKIASLLLPLMLAIPTAYGSTMGNFAPGFVGVIQIVALGSAFNFALIAIALPFALPFAMRGKGVAKIAQTILVTELFCVGLAFGSLVLSFRVDSLIRLFQQ